MKTTPNTLERLGRVVHWLAVTFAIMALALGLGVLSTNPGYNAQLIFLVSLAFSVAVLLVGRALRYILSGE